MFHDRTQVEEEASLIAQNELPGLFRALVLQSPVSTWIADKNGTLIFQNAANKERFGIERDEEVVGKYNIFKDDEVIRQGFSPQIREVFDTGGSTEFVIDYDFSRVDHVKPASPTHRILRTFIFAVTDADRRVQYVVAQHEDFTEKWRAIEALTASEANYREIFNTANDVIFVHDSETGKILDANEKIREMYGYSPEEVRGILIDKLSAPEPAFSGKKALELIRQASSGKPQLFEWKARGRSGRDFWIEVSLKRSTIGGHERVLAVVRDIGERKEAEEQLKYSLSFQQVITRLATDFINLPSDKIDGGITEALKVVGEFIGVDRSFVFLLSPDRKTFSNTHEWRAKGVASQIARLQDLPVRGYKLIEQVAASPRPVVIQRVEDIPREYSEEKRMLKLQRVKSFVALPMIARDKPIGFLGLVAVRKERTWTEESATLLRIVGEVLVNALERKQSEEALRESEERFRSLHEMAPIAIVLNRLDNGRFLESNRALQDMLGYTEDEIRGLSYWDITPREYADAEARQLKRLHTVGRYGPYEKEYVRKDGTRFPVLLNGVRLTAPDGTELIYSTIQDITERKKAEQALRLTQFAMDHAAIATFWVAPDARFIYLNEEALRHLGYSRDELLHMTVHDIDPNSRPKAWPAHWRELKKRGCFTFESLHRAKDGRVFPVDVTVNYLQFGGKEYNVAFARDITERKMEEQRKAELEEHKQEFYRRTILAATEGTLVVTERDEIDGMVGTPVASWKIRRGEDLSRVRQAIADIAESTGMEESRVYDFILAIGEATTNAYKHAGGGKVTLHRRADGMTCIVSDKGQGMEALTLPEVALTRGYSTAGSLGMGYKAILSVADKVYLATGPEGTIVAIEMNLHAPEEPLIPVGLPDTWEM